MSGVFIEYGNIAPEAKENFFPKATEKESFVELSNLQKYDLSFPNFGNPCELYQTLLDGTAKVIPSLTEPEDFGWWSIQTSDEQGQFETPITLILEAEQKYSSQGITLTFDTNNGIFSNDLNIKWYRDEELISSKDFFPDTPLYFCDNLVQFYNNVEITFYKMNMPYNRLKLNAIDYGNILKFTPKEIRGVKLIQELNPISTEI